MVIDFFIDFYLFDIIIFSYTIENILKNNNTYITKS